MRVFLVDSEKRQIALRSAGLPFFILSHQKFGGAVGLRHEREDCALHAHGLRAFDQDDIPFLHFRPELFSGAL